MDGGREKEGLGWGETDVVYEGNHGETTETRRVTATSTSLSFQSKQLHSQLKDFFTDVQHQCLPAKRWL